ncbi:NAD(P)H dehydrogenase [Bradyrhizobium canariense]|uniref:FMN dependent NADH:quinone oxidoreductase n=2 Tax=Bradyrhizobium canariense TaxID=255045 RepID=A0ABX3X8F4_9BRAD|nr:NAD(P)H-dependent oxidoreductase [Bradyrhizobium canariense]OSJ18163.1 NAD(P)H dehydrogenase [Bradyrhizobium canariense]OSJ32855.1 NAD(P)H dehydrogenase [Bradyrhizobium canariense]
MNILHVTCSPRGQISESYKLSRKIIDHLLKREPAALLVNREIGGGTIPHIDEGYASALGAAQPSPAETSPQGSMSLSEQLIRELEQSDVVIIATPMHNFTVPSSLKAWIDHIVRVRRTFTMTAAGRFATLRDRPVFVAVSSGGRFSGERAHQPDFLTPYLKAVLGIIGLHDLTFFSVEGAGPGSDALVEASARTDRALQQHFSSLDPPSPSGDVIPVGGVNADGHDRGLSFCC